MNAVIADALFQHLYVLTSGGLNVWARGKLSWNWATV